VVAAGGKVDCGGAVVVVDAAAGDAAPWRVVVVAADGDDGAELHDARTTAPRQSAAGTAASRAANGDC
jgi:hypothetical protein